VIPVEEELVANVCEQVLSLSDQQLVVRDLLSQEQLQCPLLLLQRCGLLKAASSVRHCLAAWSHDLVDELHEDLVEHTVLMISKSCERASTDFSADL
jgi:hypothetical protein